MAQPPSYNREHNFVLDEEGSLDKSKLNIELDNIALSINRIRENLEILLNDDNSLKAEIVTFESLSKSVIGELSKVVEIQVEGAKSAALASANYAKDSQSFAEQSESSAQRADQIKDFFEQNVQNEGTVQVAKVQMEGDKQVERLQNIADFEESGSGVRCVEVDWVVQSAVLEGTIVTIPQNFLYVVGRNQLRLSVNGLVLLKDENFVEYGSVDYESNQIVMKMPLAKGDEVQAWTVPLGRGSTDDLFERIKILEDSLADLSSRVVYRGEE